MITLDEGLDIARRIEKFILSAGYHCALGGSVLHAGESDKDIDIFIYPHNGRKLDPPLLRLTLKLAGLVNEWSGGKSENSADTKQIEGWSYKGQRIDIFFVQ